MEESKEIEKAEEFLASIHNGYSRVDFGLSGSGLPEFWSKGDVLEAMGKFAESQTAELREINTELRKQVKQWEAIPELNKLRKEVERLKTSLKGIARMRVDEVNTLKEYKKEVKKLQAEKEEMLDLIHDCKYPIKHIHEGNHDETKLLARIQKLLTNKH